ncbi:unnamed protein product [Trifolium pratense]|uniref:Uncharacterized protein n=1 Tax=Trifolium pratense TaxID=57577 RepID=A0ACB0KVF0_TRIPR|nr:unnamed protein product [Trifolium pratense]
MPTYAKFMKEILTKKRKFDDDEVIQLDASCSAIIQRTLPTKEKDPGRVTLPVTIGNVNVGKALIDLGSSINLIPLSVIKRIGGLDVTRTRMTLQLADKSITRPSGMAEDVLVKVDKFMFPIDFVVMDIEEDDDVPLILGRPFMKTARMMIDIDDGVMKVRVQDEEVSFNLWEAMKHPHEKDMCFKLDATEEAILDVRKQAHQPSSLEQALTESFEALDPEKEEEVESFLKQLDALKEVTLLEAKIEELKNDERPGEVKLELKTLPSHLKYAFLEEEEKKPVIISNSLSADEEKSLIQILKENKEAIGWSLSDLKVSGLIPDDLNWHQKKKFLREANQYVWDDPYLFKIGADNLLRRCVTKEEAISIMWHCHNSPYGGHYNGERTAAKVLQSGFFWPSLFKDTYEHARSCDNCQRIGGISRRNEMPLQNMHVVEVFDCWGIDFVGPFPSSFSNEYILVAVDYVSKWVEAVASPKADGKTLYKEKVKSYHDKRLLNKNFRPGQMVLLFNSRLKLFPGKLKSKWSGPFKIHEVKPYGAVVLEDPATNATWTVNGQRLKLYFGGEFDRVTTKIPLSDP